MKTTLTIVLLFIGLTGYTQDYEHTESLTPNTARFGIKAGYNAAYINNTLNVGPTHKSDFHLGVFKEYRSNSFAFQPEVVYSRQGCNTNYKGHYYYYQGETKLNLSYLTIPVLIKGIIGNKLSFYTGIQPSVLISAREKGTAEIRKSNEGIKEINANVADNYKGLDLAVPVGFEVILSKNISTSFRYSHGLTDINDDSAHEKYRNMVGLEKKTLKNQVFQVSLQYFL